MTLQDVTDGPWSIGDVERGDDARLIYCEDATGSLIARCGGQGFEYVARSKEECEAIAAYIVKTANAYPKMLDMLRVFENFLDSGDLGAADLLAKVRSLISEVGETP